MLVICLALESPLGGLTARYRRQSVFEMSKGRASPQTEGSQRGQGAAGGVWRFPPIPFPLSSESI